MHCFITGVTGFIGSAVAQQLLEENHKVTGLTHSPEKTELLEKKGVKPVVGDMRQPETWVSGVQDADAVIHTATLPVPSRPDRKYLKKLKQAQETVVNSLIEAARSCRVFVYTSGMTVYGTGKETKTEESEIDPVKLAALKPFGIPEPVFRLVGGKILAEMLLTNMIISNQKMKEKLGVELTYPTYREGVRALAKQIT